MFQTCRVCSGAPSAQFASCSCSVYSPSFHTCTEGNCESCLGIISPDRIPSNCVQSKPIPDSPEHAVEQGEARRGRAQRAKRRAGFDKVQKRGSPQACPTHRAWSQTGSDTATGKLGARLLGEGVGWYPHGASTVAATDSGHVCWRPDLAGMSTALCVSSTY